MLISIITTTSINLTNHAYGELASTINDSSLFEKSIDSNTSEVNKINFTKTTNQDNISDTMEFTPLSNNTVVYENLDKNETSFSSNITTSSGTTNSLSNSAASGSEVTADFNGDGFSDLAIGVPFEDVGTLVNAGAVNVIYGSSDGLNGTALSPENGRDDQFWTQGITGGLEANDVFGSSLATGDFNKDGFADLAIGVPFEDVGTIGDTGAVNVLYGSSGGLSTSAKPSDIWHQNSPDIEGNAEASDRFGSSLATGDFNKDGFSDLAIGVPHERIGTIGLAGAVNVIYGTSNGLQATGLSMGNGRDDQIWHQNILRVADFPDSASEVGDIFGHALATSDFNKDGADDLAIGVPGEDIGTIGGAGFVNVIYGSTEGLKTVEVSPGDGFFQQRWTQDTRNVDDGIEDKAEIADFFGIALATGDFNKDGISDLAIGASSERGVTGVRPGGAVNVIYGTSPLGLIEIQISPGNGRADQIWAQDSLGIEDEPESEEKFGSVLATGDFNKDGISDLAIGVPGENVDTIRLAGAVNVIYGSSDGLSSSNLSPGNGREDQIWHQNSVEFGAAEIEDDSEASDRFGSALATGDFNKDGISDLAIGVPQESVDTSRAGGAANVIYGSIGIHIDSGGLSATFPLGGFGKDDQIWTQDSREIQDDVERDDQFGSSLG